MTASKTPMTAEQARDAYRRGRRERLMRQGNNYVAPQITGVLGPIPGDDQTLWPLVKWDTDAAVVIPQWSPPPEAYDVITLVFEGEDQAFNTLTDPPEPKDFQFTLPAALIAEEHRYGISYRILRAAIGNELPSEPLFLTVDHTPPNANKPGEPPVLPQEVLDNGLTLDYLDNNSTLDITVPRSSDITAGDVILLYWGPVGTRLDQDPTVPVASMTVSEADALPAAPAPVVSIQAADIRKLQQGKIAILYRYVDRTGNLGQPSTWTEVYVDLEPQPDNLQLPEVPLATDGIVDRADARLGVTVQIPEPGYDNINPAQDRIEVTWEGVKVPSVAVSTFPMEIPIDWLTLSAGGALNRRTFEVSYSVLRGLFKKASAPTTVTVDFTVAGIDPLPDPDPSGPDPINDKLPRLVIKSRDNALPDNQLGEADKGQDAIAQLPSNPVKKGEFLRLYWGYLKPYVVELEITTEQPTDALEFIIPWARIEEGGYNEKLPVYYSTWNGFNEQESVRTEVDVRIIDLVALKDVEFPDRWVPKPPRPPTPDPVINCCSLPWNGIKVNVLGDPDNFALGDTLQVSWQAYEDMPGTVQIPDTDYDFSVITIDTDEQINNGFQLTVPYADYVEPIVEDGSGRLTYRLTKVSGQSGSNVTRVIVSRLGAGGALCTIDNPGYFP